MCVVELFWGVVRALQRWIQKCVVELFLGVVRALQRWIQKCVVDFFGGLLGHCRDGFRSAPS